jgi:hypothetical protein
MDQVVHGPVPFCNLSLSLSHTHTFDANRLDFVLERIYIRVILEESLLFLFCYSKNDITFKIIT